ncbi:MAG: hypothetical protein ACK53X_07160 [Holosporales bacterium]
MLKKIPLVVCIALVVLSGFGASAQQKPNQGQTLTLFGKKFCLVTTSTPEERILLEGPCPEQDDDEVIPLSPPTEKQEPTTPNWGGSVNVDPINN